MGDVQPALGYCVLLADPVVESLNALDDEARASYSHDMARIGDALLSVTGAVRINYETLGNREPALHTHITPRYSGERLFGRASPALGRLFARRFDLRKDGELMRKLRSILAESSSHLQK